MSKGKVVLIMSMLLILSFVGAENAFALKSISVSQNCNNSALEVHVTTEDGNPAKNVKIFPHARLEVLVSGDEDGNLILPAELQGKNLRVGGGSYEIISFTSEKCKPVEIESEKKDGVSHMNFNELSTDPYSELSEIPKANYYFDLGFSSLYFGEKNKALSFFDSALHEDPNFVSALVNKAIILSETGRLAEAMLVYDRALEIQPKNPYVLNNKGFALMSIGNFPEAVSYYKQAIEIKPTYLTALYNIADALRQEWYCADANYYYDKIIEINPQDPYAYNYKAWALSGLGQDEAAVSILDKLLEIDPHYLKEFTSFPIIIDEEKWSESYWENILKKYPNVWDGVSQKNVGFIVAIMSKTEIDTVCIKESFVGLDEINTSKDFELENQKNKIPDWIRNNAKWWAEEKIGDSDFTTGIQFLIKEGIIAIPETANATQPPNDQGIPPWIKNNADWWSQGLISDEDFIKGIQYLVENGIIVV